KQLNTWVSFQSAEQPLLGQFSVSGNTLGLSSSSSMLVPSLFVATAPQGQIHGVIIELKRSLSVQI
ncbi:hypothetical protein, partial [Pseudomonas aeruginosa]|uniref:hypothetical protein n=1 Tax=Pseudomonas aeruginosa TaxID=287 RepID=UPI000EB3B4E1